MARVLRAAWRWFIRARAFWWAKCGSREALTGHDLAHFVFGPAWRSAFVGFMLKLFAESRPETFIHNANDVVCLKISRVFSLRGHTSNCSRPNTNTVHPPSMWGLAPSLSHLLPSFAASGSLIIRYYVVGTAKHSKFQKKKKTSWVIFKNFRFILFVFGF